jgi:hypothetical protein
MGLDMLAPHGSARHPLRRAPQLGKDPRSGVSLKWFKSARRAAQQNCLHLQDRPCQGHDAEGTHMSQPVDDERNEPVPWMQQLLDNPFLLLFLGVLIPMLLYTVWGVVDILTLPMTK